MEGRAVVSRIQTDYLLAIMESLPVIRQRNHYVLNVDGAIESIHKLNSSTTMLASERLLDQHFRSLPDTLAPTTVAERVVLLDALWGTRLYMDSGSTDRIVTSLAGSAAMLIDSLSRLGPDTLVEEPECVIAAVVRVFPVILSQGGGSDDGFRQNYSFASKFFHWATRVHFPIVDKWARARINEIQRERAVKQIVRSSTAAMAGLTYIDEYSRWIWFYSDLINDLPQSDRHRFLREDCDSQPPTYRIKNSLLRILDKVFYVQGGGTGLGRFASEQLLET